ncbi:MAG: hypothetical protein K8F25_17095, partial [Fimbriimonadaceae bacterium]|nr:hypothetical protein [Alphaproteobacteria bacterium]
AYNEPGKKLFRENAMSRLFLAVFIGSIFGFLPTGHAGEYGGQLRDPGSIAYGEGGGLGASIRVDANWLSSSGCGRVVSFGEYAPAGAYVRHDAVPLTIVVDMAAGPCGNPRVIRKMTVIGSQGNTTLVSIFFVSTTGKLLKRENVAPQTDGGNLGD